MKYNKLKSKVEKLEMLNSETEKRKDGQIEELIRKNQELRMEVRLMVERVEMERVLGGGGSGVEGGVGGNSKGVGGSSSEGKEGNNNEGNNNGGD